MVAVLLAILPVASLGQDMATPLLTNRSFDDGVDGWDWWFNSPDLVEIEIIEDGDGSCVQFLGTPGSRVAFYQNVPVEPQSWYRIGFRYKAGPKSAGGGRFGDLSTRLVDANGNHFDYPCGMTLLDIFGEWQAAEKRLYAPLSCATVVLEFNSHGECDLRIDDVSITKIDAPMDAPKPNTWDELTTPRDERLWFSSWQYNLRPDLFRRSAMKYGWRYRLEDQFDQMLETHTTTWSVEDGAHAVFTEKGIPTCEYPYYAALPIYEERYEGRTRPDVDRLLDPVWHDCLVEACRQLIADHAPEPGIAYVFAGDEVFGKYRNALKPESARHSELWREIDDQVREQFGGGIHGLPAGNDDATPERWIAYFSWAVDEYINTLERMRAEIDDSGCGAELLGPDEASMAYPWPWRRLAEAVDVFTGQSLPYRRTANMYNTGFVTKCYRDMAGKPIHNATQIVMYAGSPSPEEVQRRYSQVLQNGGEGQMLIAEEWGDRDLSHHQYAAPERWATVKNLLKLMSTHRVRTPAKSKVGVLYSSPSMMGLGRRMDDAPISSAYAFCGPILGAWPRMIDSHALAQSGRDLKGLSLLIVPFAPVERPSVVGRLGAFAARGGTIMVCDPRAFRRDLLGERLDASAIPGGRTSRMPAQREMRTAWPRASRQRVYADESFAVLGGETLGSYADGTAAVASFGVGEGRVIRFGSNPLVDENVTDDPQWVAWWRSLLVKLRVPMDLPIWRLRLPDAALVQAESPSDVCVTGNNLVRCQNGVYLGANDPLAGHYTMSVAPDLSPESAGEGPIAFAEGDLTDRLAADLGPFGSLRIPKDPYVEADWVNRWSGDALGNGLDIEIALPEPRELTRLRFWHSGAMPALEVMAGSGDGWNSIGQVDASSVGEDVDVVEVAIDGSFSHVRLRFSSGDESFAIADVELWAREVD